MRLVATPHSSSTLRATVAPDPSCMNSYDANKPVNDNGRVLGEAERPRSHNETHKELPIFCLSTGQWAGPQGSPPLPYPRHLLLSLAPSLTPGSQVPWTLRRLSLTPCRQRDTSLADLSGCVQPRPTPPSFRFVQEALSSVVLLHSFSFAFCVIDFAGITTSHVPSQPVADAQFYICCTNQ